ncbi:adenosylmethionine decarboxylase [Colwellia asteriadis]|uniref:S-adenosylmethionine decarboxylase proenzyme n=1 Tax=Colwellia asteriadis TaxID=517723 RepID=A0ABP3WKJ6_9GAMM
MSTTNKISLYGFNNLTKSLSFSFYKVHYLDNDKVSKQYDQFINENYNAHKLSELLTHICHAIGGNVLNIASQDYQPHGASVTLMMSEEAQPESLVAHLDKSHLCIHTYPDDNPQNKLAIFRADIELSTCGVISPLKVINTLINHFNAEVIDIDYRIRGMTRDSHGNKLFIDDSVVTISDSFNAMVKSNYQFQDNNLSQYNLFHTKLARQQSSLVDIIFAAEDINLSPTQLSLLQQQVNHEINSLFIQKTNEATDK